MRYILFLAMVVLPLEAYTEEYGVVLDEGGTCESVDELDLYDLYPACTKVKQMAYHDCQFTPFDGDYAYADGHCYKALVKAVELCPTDPICYYQSGDEGPFAFVDNLIIRLCSRPIDRQTWLRSCDLLEGLELICDVTDLLGIVSDPG